jgi:hypothetical protein
VSPPPPQKKTQPHTPLSFVPPPTQQTPQSICLPLGGFKEPKYLRSYNVVVNCRRGFCRLALETGAALVPVVGAGETEYSGAPPENVPYITLTGKMTLP